MFFVLKCHLISLQGATNLPISLNINHVNLMVLARNPTCAKAWQATSVFVMEIHITPLLLVKIVLVCLPTSIEASKCLAYINFPVNSQLRRKYVQFTQRILHLSEWHLYIWASCSQKTLHPQTCLVILCFFQHIQCLLQILNKQGHQLVQMQE